MPTHLHRFAAGAALCALLACPALAQASEPIVIEQIQSGDLWSDMDVEIEDSAETASASAVTAGNAAAALLDEGDLDYTAEQQMLGDARADASLSGTAVGTAQASATAYGNASTAGTAGGDATADVRQSMAGETAARVEIDLTGASTGAISTATTAIANAATLSGEFGAHSSTHVQDSTGSVTAQTDVDMCCTDTGGTFVTTAGGNSVTATGYTSTAIHDGEQTTAAGTRIRGLTDISIGAAGDTIIATTASGNSHVLKNQWGYAALGQAGAELEQDNGSEIDAQSRVTLADWSGTAGVSAYGVGNSAYVSNIGSDTALNAIQTNSGVVGAEADLAGTSTEAGAAYLTATAIGNAATAVLCNYCGSAALGGSVRQANSASVNANGRLSIGAAGHVAGATTAVGNSATFQSGGG